MQLSRSYVLLHTTQQVQAFVRHIEYRVDVDTLHRGAAETLGLNEIGRVEITSSKPIFFDPYRVNFRTGSFVLIDPHTNATVAAGMIRGEVTRLETEEPSAMGARTRRIASPNVVWEGWNIPREDREALQGHRAAVLWFTGMSGAGKTTIGRHLERRLFERGIRTMLLDGDQLRHGLCSDLAFAAEDRVENVRRVGEVSKLFFEAGNVVLATFVSPYRAGREAARSLLPEGRFFEIHIRAPLSELKRRDTKGLYLKEASGVGEALPGSTGTYEEPVAPEMVVDTTLISVEDAVEGILRRIEAAGIIPSTG
jgi:bifunctional enzyme CysN/CysC